MINKIRAWIHALTAPKSASADEIAGQVSRLLKKRDENKNNQSGLSAEAESAMREIARQEAEQLVSWYIKKMYPENFIKD